MGVFLDVAGAMMNLEKSFETLNKDIFSGELGKVQFVTVPKEKTIFNLSLPNTIEIGSGIKEPKDTVILDDLVHVMVHLQNNCRGIIDYTSNQYHRREFCELALQTGLFVGYHKTHGWSVTKSNRFTYARTPTRDANHKLKIAYTKILPLDESVDRYRQQMTLALECRSQRIFQHKYICECDPPFIIRCGKRPDSQKPLQAVCEVCHKKFALSE